MLCKYFDNGFCSSGNKCPFAHGGANLRREIKFDDNDDNDEKEVILDDESVILA